MSLVELQSLLGTVTESFETTVWNSAAYLAGLQRLNGTDELMKTERKTKAEMCFTTLPMTGLNHLWLADSGASTHMGPSKDGMFNIRPDRAHAQFRNGTVLQGLKVGDRRVTKIDLDGSQHSIVLKDFKHVPGLQVHLFSLTKAMQYGWQ